MAKKSLSKSRRALTPTSAEVDTVFRLLREAPPAITWGAIDQLEGWLDDQNSDRVCALAMLACSGDALVQTIAMDREGAILAEEVLHSVRQESTRYRKLSELLEVAQARVSTALCIRADMKQIFKEGTAKRKADARACEEAMARISIGTPESRTNGDVTIASGNDSRIKSFRRRQDVINVFGGADGAAYVAKFRDKNKRHSEIGAMISRREQTKKANDARHADNRKNNAEVFALFEKNKNKFTDSKGRLSKNKAAKEIADQLGMKFKTVRNRITGK